MFHDNLENYASGGRRWGGEGGGVEGGEGGNDFWLCSVLFICFGGLVFVLLLSYIKV